MVTPGRADDAYRFDALRPMHTDCTLQRSPRDQQHGGADRPQPRSRGGARRHDRTAPGDRPRQRDRRVTGHEEARLEDGRLAPSCTRRRWPPTNGAIRGEPRAVHTRVFQGDVTRLPVDELPGNVFHQEPRAPVHPSAIDLPSSAPGVPGVGVDGAPAAGRARWRRPCPTRRPLLALADLPETPDRFRRTAGSK